MRARKRDTKSIDTRRGTSTSNYFVILHRFIERADCVCLLFLEPAGAQIVLIFHPSELGIVHYIYDNVNVEVT